MLCPYCGYEESKVVDKRDFGPITKRRRECLNCERRFNTQETVEHVELKVIKKDGTREPFSIQKMKSGITRACEKRPVSEDQIDKIIERVSVRLQKKGKEVKSVFIGELISRELKKIDKVSYIRFASVYKDFADLDDFREEIKELVKK